MQKEKLAVFPRTTESQLILTDKTAAVSTTPSQTKAISTRFSSESVPCAAVARQCALRAGISTLWAQLSAPSQ